MSGAVLTAAVVDSSLRLVVALLEQEGTGVSAEALASIRRTRTFQNALAGDTNFAAQPARNKGETQ